MRTIRLLIALGALGIVALAAAAPSVARSGCVGHPRDASVACVRNDHWIDVCDRDRDGHRVRAWYFHQGRPFHEPNITGWDENGARRGCHREGSTWGLNITRFRVCVEHEGCSRWARP
jgi:hypothetical protein